MSRTILLPRGASLIDAIIPILEDTGNDLERAIVVFPGRRPSHFLLSALSRRIGKAFLPPRIFSIDAFVEHLYASLPDARVEAITLDVIALLHGIHCAMSGRPGDDRFVALDAFIPFGRKLFSELEEVVLSGMTPQQVVDAGRAQSNQLAEYYGPFYERVAQRGWTTRSMRYRSVAGSLRQAGPGTASRIVMAGFFSLNETERSLFSYLASLDNSVFVFQDGDRLRQQKPVPGILLPSGVADSTMPRITYHAAPDTHGQVMALATMQSRLMVERGAPDEQSVIVLPASSTLFPVLHHALPVLDGSAFNISLGYPLGRTPLFGFLSTLGDLLASQLDGRFHASEYLKCVLHPYPKNTLYNGRPEVSRMLFHIIAEYLTATPSRNYMSLGEIEEDEDLMRSAAQRISGAGDILSPDDARRHLLFVHDAVIRPFTDTRTIGEFTSRLFHLLSFVQEHTTASNHALFRQFLGTFRSALDQMQFSIAHDTPLESPTACFTVLRHLLAGVQVSFPGTPLNGLQVLGFLETRNIRFDTVFILDANDDVLPGVVQRDTLLTPSLRRHLGLPAHREKEDIAAYYLDQLVAGAQDVHVFYTDEGHKELSRFFQKMRWEEELSGGKPPAAPASIRYDISLANPPPPRVEKTDQVIAALRRMQYSASALDTYLRCPLKFYYEHVLRLSEPAAPTDDIGRSDIGDFVHDILRRFMEPHVGRMLAPESLTTSAIVDLVDRHFSAKFGTMVVGGNFLLKQQIATQLEHFVTGYQHRVLTSQPAELLGLELRLTTTLDGFGIRGTLDRVERRNGRICILDYKTGAGSTLRVRPERLLLDERDSWEDAVGSLQLPVYAFLYADAFHTDLNTIVPAYLLLGTATIDPSIESPLLPEGSDAQEIFSQLRELVRRLLQEIIDPAIPFVHARDLQKQCPRCPFTGICGTTWVRESEW